MFTSEFGNNFLSNNLANAISSTSENGGNPSLMYL